MTVSEHIAVHMTCDIQETDDGRPRMCGTCWRAACEDLTPEDLQTLLAAYPPAVAAQELWGSAPPDHAH